MFKFELPDAHYTEKQIRDHLYELNSDPAEQAYLTLTNFIGFESLTTKPENYHVLFSEMRQRFFQACCNIEIIVSDIKGICDDKSEISFRIDRVDYTDAEVIEVNCKTGEIYLPGNNTKH